MKCGEIKKVNFTIDQDQWNHGLLQYQKSVYR